MKQYDYMEAPVAAERLTEYLDGYESFGWMPDERFDANVTSGTVTMRLRRDGNILNKTELTRLQRNFESCLQELDALEGSKQSAATIAGLVTGFIGLAFIAGAVFAATAARPLYGLMVILAIPGFLLCALAPKVSALAKQHRAETVVPLEEKKREEILELLKKGQKLMEL